MPAQGFKAQALINKDEEARRHSSLTMSPKEHINDSPPAHASAGRHANEWPGIGFSISSRTQLPKRKRAALIGVTYLGTRGQLPDSNVGGLACLLNRNYGYREEDIVMLTDMQQRPTSQPTKKQILLSMHWLVKDSRAGDHLLFYYCGHGDLERALVPLDFLENGFIKMTDLQDIMTSQQIPGVLMTVIIDWYGHESSMQEWFGIL
ncbi:caspase domain-containing protein [Fusarium oxysporum II5]|uniref:Peptidase C14 caspase domain-containing protein n=2 Tax=Fusarium oxysporum species complex TaxID=171631 RepID=X0J421_FUSO5|nr:uncharacterized protein FOIG_15686 [Fusarium odoratissimum NRRL 54006]EXL91111.1 hypothetical protein FOIG_15686 [Fusarium odoratissimum NRRL 54006]KAK2127633.1 caspase domain-containing protein [Fusarium oxysporum II5]